MRRIRVEFLDGEVAYYRTQTSGILESQARVLSITTVEGPMVVININVVRVWTVEEEDE